MSSPPPFCFFIMPFREELNFLYLYLRSHLQEKHGLRVERGDHNILTIPILEKVRNQIQEAKVVVADISGRNPNVFYEIGLAHAYEKPVILMTSDPITETPTDVRHFEFIKYNLAHDQLLLSQLDNAIHNVFVERFKELYERAESLLKDFNGATSSNYRSVDLEEFRDRVIQGERVQGLPDPGNAFLTADFLLPRVIQDVADGSTMRKITTWVSEHFT
jgi:nucleoside 2-deoxyribosyltransferase